LGRDDRFLALFGLFPALEDLALDAHPMLDHPNLYPHPIPPNQKNKNHQFEVLIFCNCW
jgi:hypothetical protein